MNVSDKVTTMSMKINPKYVKLLNEAFEKYENKNSEQDDAGKIDQNSQSTHQSKNDCVKEKKVFKTNMSRKKTYGFKRNKFLEYEDELLLQAIVDNNINYKELSVKLNRHPKSIVTRIHNLKTGRNHKDFTKEEDMIIIDEVLKKMVIKDVKEFNFDIIQNPMDLITVAEVLKRVKFSVYDRWMRFLRVTLESYVQKTLNLDIKLLLANYLADHFKSIDDIDWQDVLKKKEFSGHSEFSLRKLFWSSLVRNASSKLSLTRFELSLKQIAKFASESKQHPSKKYEERQRFIINYFEKACDINRIRFNAPI